MANHDDILHLKQMLDIALKRENDKWCQYVYSTEKTQTIITSEMRQEAVSWLMKLNDKFSFYPETLFLSVAILDRFLNLVKAQPKYLKCITVSCFYIAAKTNEEDEMIPSTMDLIEESYCGCSMSELLRMECCILNKLNWDVNMSTSVNFLHLYYGLLLANCPDVFSGWLLLKPAQHLHYMTQLLQQCLLHHELLNYTPSTVALSVLSLHLKLFWPYWASATVTLQALIQVGDKDLDQCSSYIMTFLGGWFLHLKVLKPSSNQPHLTLKRKVEDEDDIYDGIKRLYSEDAPDSSAAVILTCSSEVSRMSSTKFSKPGKAT
jgi:hypothetical protein